MMRFFLYLFLLFLSGHLRADDDLRLSHSNKVRWRGNGSENYDCFDPQTYNYQLDGSGNNFYVRYDKDTETPFFITFSTGNSSTFNRVLSSKKGYELSYQLYKGSALQNPLKDKPDATEDEVITGYIEDEGSPRRQSQSYTMVVFPQQIVPKGTYKDEVSLKLYSGVLYQSHEQQASKTVRFQVKVPEILKLFIGPYGGGLSEVSHYQVDFGDLQEGDSRRLGIGIYSNTGYEIFLRSQNQGFLNHTEIATVPQSDKGDHQVRYYVSFDSIQVPLTSSGDHLVENHSTNSALEGDSYSLEISIGNVGQKMDGDYQDTLTLSVRSS